MLVVQYKLHSSALEMLVWWLITGTDWYLTFSIDGVSASRLNQKRDQNSDLGLQKGIWGHVPERVLWISKLHWWDWIAFQRWKLVFMAFSATFLFSPPVVDRSSVSLDSFGLWFCFIHLSPRCVCECQQTLTNNSMCKRLSIFFKPSCHKAALIGWRIRKSLCNDSWILNAGHVWVSMTFFFFFML